MLDGFKSAQDCKRECLERPLNAVLFSDDILQQIADGTKYTLSTRASAIAELAVRFFLRPDRHLPFLDLLRHDLGGCFERFSDWCSRSLIEQPDAETIKRLLGDDSG